MFVVTCFDGAWGEKLQQPFWSWFWWIWTGY